MDFMINREIQLQLRLGFKWKKSYTQTRKLIIIFLHEKKDC
jgi:hypothetical protein